MPNGLNGSTRALSFVATWDGFNAALSFMRETSSVTYIVVFAVAGLALGLTVVLFRWVKGIF